MILVPEVSMSDVSSCHHCSSPVGDSPYLVVLETLRDDHTLPLCRSCQSMRQGGQLPVDLLVQQWAYARSGADAGQSSEVDDVLVRLDCLGCGGALSRIDQAAAARSETTRRLPDGSLITECITCQRTNLLRRRGQQMVAICLWG
jgi:hypothetical protein